VEVVRQRHCVLLQLDNVAPEEAQRIVDFMAGAISALDGQVERIGECTFLFAPAGVTVSHS
jgi:cell division inhibitor SepF